MGKAKVGLVRAAGAPQFASSRFEPGTPAQNMKEVNTRRKLVRVCLRKSRSSSLIAQARKLQPKISY